MADMTPRTIDVHLEKETNGEVKVARIRFGPHYHLEVQKERGKISFALLYTHHGFKADASEVDGQLERIIKDIQRAYPHAAVD